MKRNVLCLLIAVITMFDLSAGNYEPKYTIDLPFTPTVLVQEHTDCFKYFLNSTEKDMAMVDGLEGKILWHINLTELTGNKKTVNQIWNQKANVILVYNEDTKKGVAVKYFIDGKTGKLLWKSEKYMSEYGGFSLNSNFRLDYDEATNGVVLPTTESIDLINVNTGEIIWSKPYTLTDKIKEFNCFIMANYHLVRVMTGNDSEFYLSVDSGEEVSDIESHYDKKKALEYDKRNTIVTIPEKGMYVVMRASNNSLSSLLGIGGLASWKMDFLAYREGTNELLWHKNYLVAHSYDFISKKSFVRMIYLDGKVFIEHMPNMKGNSGLTVLNADNGDKIWECYYTTLEDKGGPNNKVYTPFPAPDPIALNNNIYVVDKIKNKMYCYSGADGNLKWETEKFPDAQKIPTLIGYDKVVILGYGGPEKKISCIIEEVSNFVFEYSNNYKAVYKSGNKKYTYKYIFNDEDKFGLTAYDAASGEILWSHESISKALKDKFSYIAGTLLFDGKLLVATDKNLFVLNPGDGSLISSYAIKEQKLGDIWKLHYVPEKDEVLLNCNGGIVKIDLKEQKLVGSIKVSNVQGPVVSEIIGADDPYSDYAVFTSGDVKKMEYKSFASIDLEQMKVRGSESAEIIFSDEKHFSEGAEYYYKNDGKTLSIYKIKN
ncbi:MAG: PQQ-binding-like beta-propeller repeat protein [Bacteroidales bacterium]|nr:PQQ-binding-like beta-propeller repeat protein [Bacteroidales bacterium]MBN2820406.1 PQQ-binding-like beta-propeller repeat protein [Bacteroidales bacterium]